MFLMAVSTNFTWSIPEYVCPFEKVRPCLCLWFCYFFTLYQHIHLEVYDVDNLMKKYLDTLEGVGEYYDVENVEIKGQEGGEKILVYVLNNFKQELLLLQLIDNYTEEHCKTYVKRADRKHPKEYVISQVKNVSKKLQ